MTKPLISILTPTYNRSDLLERVFDSLKHQTIQNFEWIIIDDGSTDHTQDIVKEFKPSDFNIFYYKKDNGGKHTALNLGIKKAKGEFILMLDSDDFLPKNSIEIIQCKIENLPKNVGGIIGRKADLTNKIIGSSQSFTDFLSNSIDLRFKYHVAGDLTEVYKRDIFQQFLFPVFENEKFCPEALVWNRIAQHYDLLFFNEAIYIADYQQEGLTSSIVKIRMNSPKATLTHYSELASYNIPFKEKIKANINFWRFSFNEKDWSFKRKVKMVQPIFIPLCLPLGFFMFLNDKRCVK